MANHWNAYWYESQQNTDISGLKFSSMSKKYHGLICLPEKHGRFIYHDPATSKLELRMHSTASEWPGQATHQSKSCRRCSMSINLMNLNLPHHYCHSTWLSWLVMLNVIGVYQVLTINWNNLKDQAIEDHSSFRYVILAVYCMSHRVIILENLTAR